MDTTTPATIKCKLWGRHAEPAINTGALVVVQNVEVNRFDNIPTVNSTLESTIQVSVYILH